MMDKQQQYDDLLPAIGSLIEGEHEEMSVLANVAAVLKEHFEWFWVGFYLEREGELRLGPFQGSIACMHIAGMPISMSIYKPGIMQTITGMHRAGYG